MVKAEICGLKAISSDARFLHAGAITPIKTQRNAILDKIVFFMDLDLYHA